MSQMREEEFSVPHCMCVVPNRHFLKLAGQTRKPVLSRQRVRLDRAASGHMPYKFHWDWLINKDFRPFLEAFFINDQNLNYENDNPKINTSFTFTTFRAYEAKVVLFFGLEAVFTLKTASKKGQLWQPSAAPFFDQMTPDQVHSGPKHVLYHLWEREGDLKKLTRPSGKTTCLEFFPNLPHAMNLTL